MKKLFVTLITMNALALVAHSQVQMGAQLSQLTGHGKSDNHSSLTGAAIQGKYFLNDNVAVGTVVHIYKAAKSKYTAGNITYWATDDVTNIAATYDVLVGSKNSLFQPYVGADMGISTSNHNVEYVNDFRKSSTYKIKQTYLMISPKVGIKIIVAKSFGIFSQVQYNFSPGNGNPRNIDVVSAKGVYSFSTEPISKYFNIDAGVYLKLVNIKKILKEAGISNKNLQAVESIL